MSAQSFEHETTNKSQTVRIRSWAELGWPGSGPGLGPSERDFTVVTDVAAAQIYLEGLKPL